MKTNEHGVHDDERQSPIYNASTFFYVSKNTGGLYGNFEYAYMMMGGWMDGGMLDHPKNLTLRWRATLFDAIIARGFGGEDFACALARM